MPHNRVRRGRGDGSCVRSGMGPKRPKPVQDKGYRRHHDDDTGKGEAIVPAQPVHDDIDDALAHSQTDDRGGHEAREVPRVSALQLEGPFVIAQIVEAKRDQKAGNVRRQGALQAALDHQQDDGDMDHRGRDADDGESNELNAEPSMSVEQRRYRSGSPSPPGASEVAFSAGR